MEGEVAEKMRKARGMKSRSSRMELNTFMFGIKWKANSWLVDSIDYLKASHTCRLLLLYDVAQCCSGNECSTSLTMHCI